MVVAGDPTSIQADDQNCCQRHPDGPHEVGIRPVYTRWMKCPKVGRDRSDEMRSVRRRGCSPCLEFRGVLGDILVSDGWLRSVIRAKFRVSRAVATWDARTLSTATRLFTNSADNCMANEHTARTNQASKAAELRMRTCVRRNTEVLLPLVFGQRSYDKPDGRHAGMALTGGGYFGL